MPQCLHHDGRGLSSVRSFISELRAWCFKPSRGGRPCFTGSTPEATLPWCSPGGKHVRNPAQALLVVEVPRRNLCWALEAAM